MRSNGPGKIAGGGKVELHVCRLSGHLLGQSTANGSDFPERWWAVGLIKKEDEGGVGENARNDPPPLAALDTPCGAHHL